MYPELGQRAGMSLDWRLTTALGSLDAGGAFGERGWERDRRAREARRPARATRPADLHHRGRPPLGGGAASGVVGLRGLKVGDRVGVELATASNLRIEGSRASAARLRRAVPSFEEALAISRDIGEGEGTAVALAISRTPSYEWSGGPRRRAPHGRVSRSRLASRARTQSSGILLLLAASARLRGQAQPAHTTGRCPCSMRAHRSPAHALRPTSTTSSATASRPTRINT